MWTPERIAETDRILWAQARRMLPYDSDGRREDMVQDAWLALIERYPFDPSFGVSFPNFVLSRGRWAMRDAGRAQPIVGMIRRVNGELRANSTYSLDAPVGPDRTETFADYLAAPSKPPSDLFLAERIARAFDGLPGRCQRTIRELKIAVETLSLKYKVSESAVNMRRRHARHRFQVALAEQGIGAEFTGRVRPEVKSVPSRKAQERRRLVCRFFKHVPLTEVERLPDPDYGI